MKPSEFESRGLYDSRDPGATDRLALLRFLEEQGLSVEEMVEASRRGRLPFAAADPLVRGGRERLTLDEAARRAGVPEELARKLNRAVGFPNPGPDGPFLTEEDVELLPLFTAATTLFGEEVSLQLARVVGSAMARIAEAEISAIVLNIAAPLVTEGSSELEQAKASVQVASLLPQMARLLDRLHRTHIESAIKMLALSRRNLADRPDALHLAVGFADLVGFTVLSQRLSTTELAQTIASFEATASDVVTAGSGRMVKMIGDEVMFIAPDAPTACEIALSLFEQLGRDPRLPKLRAGIGVGEMVAMDGDFFGPVVNLASRIARVASEGGILVSREVMSEVESGHAAYAFERSGSHELKGIEHPVEAFTLARRSPVPSP